MAKMTIFMRQKINEIHGYKKAIKKIVCQIFIVGVNEKKEKNWQKKY